MFFRKSRTYIYSVDINNATRDAVFNYASAPAYWPFCHPSSVEVKQVEGQPPIELKNSLPFNKRVVEITQLFILQQTITWSCTASDPGKKFTIEGSAFGAEGKITYTFEDNPDGSVKFTRIFDLIATNILTQLAFVFQIDPSQLAVL